MADAITEETTEPTPVVEASIDAPVEAGVEIEIEIEAGEPEEAEDAETSYAIVLGHPECAGPEGSFGVVAICCGEFELDSCHADQASAQARIDEIAAAMAILEPAEAATEDAVELASDPNVGNVTISITPAIDTTGLEHVAELAASVRETLDMLQKLNPSVEFSPVVASGPGEVTAEFVAVDAVELSEIPNAVSALVEAEAAIENAEEAAAATAEFDWEGVLAVEGIPSGDGRMISEGALTHRDLPIPLMLQTVNASGHDGAIICGSIHEITRDGQNVLARGMFDSGAAGREARRLLNEGTMRGVSADIDSVVVEFIDGGAPDSEPIMVLTEGRIMGATLTPFPAFQEAYVKVLASDAQDDALVASGSAVGDVWRVSSPVGVWPAGGSIDDALALVASGGADSDVPANPPAAWFSLEGFEDYNEPFTVFPDGRCYGLIARSGSCHLTFPGECKDVPLSTDGYRAFRNKSVLTAEGSLVKTGPIFMDTVHPSLQLVASDAQAHYGDTGCAVADVALFTNNFGIFAAGAQRPGLTPAQVRRFRGSDVSPDWRVIRTADNFRGHLEIVGLLSVNVSGFIVDSLVASGAPQGVVTRGRYDSASGEVTALVAAGMVHKSAPASMEEIEALAAQVEAMAVVLDDLILTPAREARERRLAAVRSELGLEDADTQTEAVDDVAELATEEDNEEVPTEDRLSSALGVFGIDVPSCGCGGEEDKCACEAVAE